MTNQIADEYHRVLVTYAEALNRATALIRVELEILSEADAEHRRFYVRHSLLDLADTILDTDRKLKVFDNFSWEPPK